MTPTDHRTAPRLRPAVAARWLAVFVVLLARPALAQVVPDTTATSPADTTAVGPERLPPPPAPPDGDDDRLQAPVVFAAADSLVIVFGQEAGDVGTLAGEAHVTYEDAALQAGAIDLVFELDELRARGLPSDTGLVGRPRFRQGQDDFSGDVLAYNLGTGRGRVVGAQTVLDDGFIRADVVKVTEDSTLFVRDGVYTTCSCITDPSYSLRADRMKVVDQEWIYTGPIQLYLFNIPTPLWLPFGFLPAQEGRRSGPLPPRYGEDDRGFYLRDWGWYWAINQYMDLQLQFGLWTRGSWQVTPLYRYVRRYRYSGQFQLDFARSRSGERDDPDFAINNQFLLRWNHQQTINPTSNFGANVNLSSASYFRTISEQYDDRVRQTVESSVRYDKRWPRAGRSFNVNLSQRQVLATGEASLTLPQLSFSQNTRNPFKADVRAPGRAERWYERISYSYTGSLSNQYAFTPLPSDTLAARGDPAASDISWYEALVSADAFRRATGREQPFDFRASHRVPVNASFTVNRIPVVNRTLRMNLTPFVQYTEDWYISTTRRRPDSLGVVTTETVPGFFSLRQFSSGLSANTTFYGLFPVRVGPYAGLRHTVRPSLSFSYRPDFSGAFWGYARTYTDATGRAVRYPIVGGVQTGRQQALSLNVANVFETKRVETDAEGAATTRSLQLLTVDVASAYNFAADSLHMGNVALNARTRLFGQMDVNFRAAFSPYTLDPAGSRVIDRYVAAAPGWSLARLTQLSLTARTSLRSDTGRPGLPASSPRARPSALPGFGNPDPGSPDPFQGGFRNTDLGYADFAIPWSLSLDLTFELTRPLATLTRRAIVNAAFDFNVTPQWKVQGRSGVDVLARELSTTSLVLLRDFECWQMSLSWVPFGQFQSYAFDLHVKSGKLRDLLRLRQPRADVRGRFSGLL